MAYDICKDTHFVCGDRTARTTTSSTGHTQITQNKTRLYTMDFCGTPITLQSLDRAFQIEYHESWVWTGSAVFNAFSPDPYFCGEKTGVYGASISEDITIVDTDLLYMDHVNKILFWRERTETCKFAKPNDKVAMFRGGYGTFYSYWFEIKIPKTAVDRYYLLVNDVKELIETYNHIIPEPGITNILYPLPPSSVGPTGNPDDAPSSFYDYYMDEQLRISDGGIDWYYPSWMRSMGIHKEEDQGDASDRYEWFLRHGVVLSPSEKTQMPKLYNASPTGNAAVDAEGNILVSFTGKDITVNRMYVKLPDGAIQQVDLNTLAIPIMEGEGLKLYPVSVV